MIDLDRREMDKYIKEGIDWNRNEAVEKSRLV